MRYRYAIKICNTDKQYRYAIHICNTDMQDSNAIKICSTDMQYTHARKICRYAIQISNKDMYYRDAVVYAKQICNTDSKIEAVRGSDATVCSRYAIKNLPCPISPPSVYPINPSHS